MKKQEKKRIIRKTNRSMNMMSSIFIRIGRVIATLIMLMDCLNRNTLLQHSECLHRIIIIIILLTDRCSFSRNCSSNSNNKFSSNQTEVSTIEEKRIGCWMLF